VPSDIGNMTYGNGIKLEWKSDGLERVFCPECGESIFGEQPEPTYQRKLDEWMREREWRFFAVFAIHVIMLVCTLITGMIIVFGPPA